MSSKIQSTSPLGPDGIVRCHHGEQVNRLVSGMSAQNPGREFYKCSRPQSEQCRFFYWTDDPIFTKRPSHTVSYPMTPTQASHTLSTPQPTLPKRKCPSPTTPRGSESSVNQDKKRRLEHIEAGLRARRQDLTPSQPQLLTPEQDDVLQFTDGLQRVAVTFTPSSNRTSTDVQQEIEPPRKRYSFLGLSPSQSSEPGAVPSTPKKPPSSTGYGGTSSSALLTPPRSAARPNRIEAFPPAASSSSRPEPVTPTRNKGKERACPGWDALVDAPETNSDIQSWSKVGIKTEANALQTASPHTPLSSFGSQGPSLTPMTGERISTHLAEAQESVHALYTLFEHLQELDAGKYVERLERQRHALALGEEFKKKHIAALVAERDDLREKLRESEENNRAKDEMIAQLTGEQQH